MSEFLSMIKNGGVPAFVIMGLGAFALVLVAERVRVLYFQYGIKAQDFSEKVKNFILAEKVSDAIQLCHQHKSKPLAQSLQILLERSDRDDEAIYQAQEVALSETLPLFSKRLGYLSMISNVSTLVGLLGTVYGLILSFAAVSNADPSQKQVLLAKGISLAMSTTALGLSIAIPTMVAYAFLQARQTQLTEETIEHSSKIVETLSNRHYQELSQDSVFPNSLNKSQVESSEEPPAPNLRIA